MAKTKERKALKKGKAAFNLIGRVKVTDKTFNLDNSYDSGWTDNSMYVGVDWWKWKHSICRDEKWFLP